METKHKRSTKAEVEARRAREAAIKAWYKKMEDYGYEVSSKNGVFIITIQYHTSFAIEESWRQEFDKHERLIRSYLEKNIDRHIIFISEISRQHEYIKRELYIKCDIDYLIGIPENIWLGLKDFVFVPF